MADDLESAIGRQLFIHVAPLVEDILRKHIVKDIYGFSWDTHKGIRSSWYGEEEEGTHKTEGQLTREISTRMIANDTILTTSTASANEPLVEGYELYDMENGGFLQMLEVGDMGFLSRRANKLFPRPAISHAQAEVDASPEIKRKIKECIDNAIKELNS